MKSDLNLEDMLLQAAGRTGGSSSGRPHGNAKGRQSSYSDGSSDSDPEPANPRYNKKKPPSSSQVPLKKRHQSDRGGKSRDYSVSDDDSDGADSDSAPSVGSDLYKDEDDKEQLEKMSELQREMILAERSTIRDDYKLKKMAMARAQGGKGDKGGGGGGSGARGKRESSPPPPATVGRGSAGRTSVRGAEKSSATRIALDELRRKRMRQQDPEGYRNRFKSFAGDGLADHDRSPPPLRRRTGSPPSDGGKSDSDDHKDDELPEDSPTRKPGINFDDIKDITIPRTRLLKWFMDPFFEELLPGCFVRVGIHQSKDGRRKYRLYMVRSVDASDPDKTYKFEHYTTYKYLILVTRTETSIDKCKMAEVSDSPPEEKEFQEWLQLAESNGMRVPTRQELLEKKEAIQSAVNFVYSAETVKQLLQEKKLASLRPANVAAEKDRLRKELEVVRARHDDGEADRILNRLKQLEQIQPKQVDSKAARLAEMNRRNRVENFKNASEMKPVNTGLKAGEAGYDPFSRRWTRSRNYYVSKPDGEGSTANVGADDGEKGEAKGVAETVAAQEAAAGAGKLVDTKAPVDPGTAMYQLHNFEVHIDLMKLQQLGSTPAERVFRGRLLRRQRQEMTIGCKVPESDGKRHPLTLSVSDYKRRRGLL
ncbi:RNA polymerase-associated RTF1-like protein [Rhynchospora pubera]|uniref:RNA polymerase-associated RTF1-like protein n=1 Tax=Rhynchospora pubera TaxID=906938 RepID=A0AAV8G9A1_9POAL|nr:RNA polymerase-associated RTF1-like protein [Rhynchospora pubera]